MAMISLSNEIYHNIHLHDQQAYPIQIKASFFKFTIEQYMFLAPSVLNYFQTNLFPFKISFESENDLNYEQLIHSMKKIESLFLNEKEIEIEPEEVSSFSFLAKKFQNCLLQKTCDEIQLSGEKNYFSFSIFCLQKVPLKILQKYETFLIEINKTKYRVNPFLFGSVSKKVREAYDIGINEIVLEYTHLEKKLQINELMYRFYFFFHGFPIDISDLDEEVVTIFSEDFGIESILNGQNFKKKDMNLNEAIFNLKKEFFSNTLKEFSIKVLASNFYKVLEKNDLKEEVKQIPLHNLDLVLSSDELKIKTEDDLFLFVVSIQDPNFIILFKHLKLNHVEQTTLSEYFNAYKDGDFCLEFLQSILNRFRFSFIDYNQIITTIDQQREKLSRKEFMVQLENITKLISEQEKKKEEFSKCLFEFGMEFIKSLNRSIEDWRNAASLFQCSSELNSIEGKWRYARCLSKGLGVEKDIIKAKEIFNSIKNVSDTAKFFYSKCLSDKDPEKKEKEQIIQELVFKNYTYGLWDYGITLVDSPSQNDQSKGRKLLKTAAETGKKLFHERLQSFYMTPRAGFIFNSKQSSSHQKEASKIKQYTDEELFLLDEYK